MVEEVIVADGGQLLIDGLVGVEDEGGLVVVADKLGAWGKVLEGLVEDFIADPVAWGADTVELPRLLLIGVVRVEDEENFLVVIADETGIKGAIGFAFVGGSDDFILFL